MAATGLMPKKISVNGTQAVTGTWRKPWIVGSPAWLRAQDIYDGARCDEE
jgi:hypothetical protein